jgi:hypothetical protein
MSTTPSAGVAAAANTLTYHMRYGEQQHHFARADSLECDSEDPSCTSSDNNPSSDDVEYVPNELDCLDDDDDDDILIDLDSEDELRSSFPKNRARTNRVFGGPQRPDVSKLGDSEAAVKLKHYKAARKKYTDKQRLARVASTKSVFTSLICSGCQDDHLRPMGDVDKNRLSENQTFQSKDVLHLRIAEEANLRGITTRAVRSDSTNMTVVGITFYVNATFSEKLGWTVQSAVCREGDDILKIPPKDVYRTRMDSDGKVAHRTPVKSKYIVPFIKDMVARNPSLSTKYIKSLMKPYAKEYALTNSVVQEARDVAKAELFGKAEDNVKYAHGVAHLLRQLGHEVELIFSDRRQAVKKACAIVLLEEVERRVKEKEATMDKQEQREYIKKWKADNEVYLSTEFGMEDSPRKFSFLSGILFATSTSKHLVPLAQDLIQADGAHCEYGKYTLFSAYVTTANGNMSPIAFGLLFGNEDTNNWSKFWVFVKKIHPCVNAPAKTIMTDQDKGVIASILAILPEAAQFHCSFHRIQNINKKCGGGTGATPLSALWMYKKLSSCNSVAHLEQVKATYYEEMHPTDRHYLTKLPDQVQYPAARCAMGDNICMYSKSASSGVESMNNANTPARERTAVDILNATILLIQLEGGRFMEHKQNAWDRKDPQLGAALIKI